MNEMERRVRERRQQILMVGDGDEGLSEQEAHETLEVIADQDGEHLAQTDPDLWAWLECQLYHN